METEDLQTIKEILTLMGEVNDNLISTVKTLVSKVDILESDILYLHTILNSKGE